ncbi:hypothetical protein SAMN05216266_12760 [Amycolatopsis marina]|uniref:Uncharacterized protein n=1 Tax=Amycolatopsis marina TaxID=490629 RepID=A0A1I1CEZ1_9PSEU|nr:hypothetical protein [Amycolatopsis marina]SFB61225.1 hypothetical protein SAMN05216266_12760 [Amycolatopsis marina]
MSRYAGDDRPLTLAKITLVTFSTALIASSLVLLIFTLASPPAPSEWPGVLVHEDGSVSVSDELQDERSRAWVARCSTLGNRVC